MTDLVVATHDRDLLAAMVDVVEPAVFRVPCVESGAEFAQSINALFALGPDMLTEAISLNFPYAVLYTNRSFLHLELLSRMHPVGIYELPLEVDFLHEKLGFFHPLQRNGTRP